MNPLPLPGRASPSEASEWTATGHEPPVFLDERGRRRRWVAAGGALSATGAALWLGALVAGTVGFNALPTLPSQSSTPQPAPIVAGSHRVGVFRFVRLNRATPLARARAAALSEGRSVTTAPIKLRVTHRHRLTAERTLALADVL